MKNIILRRYVSPCGELVLGSIDRRLCLCDWQVEPRRHDMDRRLQRLLNARMGEGRSKVLDSAMAQLDEYFYGRRQTFNVPLLLAGTDFQKTVWNHLLAIPYGTTMSYAELAQRIGKPKAVRAVANATGANPMSIFIPCHRIIGSNRLLTGYAGGLEAKRRLLLLEDCLYHSDCADG